MEETDKTSYLFGQINLNHSSAGSNDFIKFASTHIHAGTPIIFGLQEPHLKNDGMISTFRNSDLIYDRGKLSRAALFHSSEITMTPHPTYTGRDIATGYWNTGDPTHPQILVTSVYMDGDNEEVWPSPLVPLIKHAIKKKLELIILADCNAWNTLWGMDKTNSRGTKIEDLIMKYNISIPNVGGLPKGYTYSRANSKTIPDVSFATPGIASLTRSWEA